MAKQFKNLANVTSTRQRELGIESFLDLTASSGRRRVYYKYNRNTGRLWIDVVGVYKKKQVRSTHTIQTGLTGNLKKYAYKLIKLKRDTYMYTGKAQ